MAAQTLVTLLNMQLAFGHHALLDKANLVIQTDERIGLIGRNGAGKSSLLRILDNRIQADDGEISRLSSLKIATVEQEPILDDSKTILDEICEDYLEIEDWGRPTRALTLIEKLGLNPDAKIEGLSGGTRKRIALAKAVVAEPDLLLLDEPTNHLDFDGIQWLEELLRSARCSCIIITHDRRFLDNITTRIIELDRGQLHSFPGNFSQWQERKAEWLAAEQIQNDKFDKILAQEEVWIRKGIEARRTRNEGRVRRLEQLRRDRSARRERVGNVNLAIDSGERSGKLVAELIDISQSFGDKNLINNYSTTILRGDRIGLIGPNGVGKSTLLKIILGELSPSSGKVRLGTNINIAYFDQMREKLDDNATLLEVINPGSEWIEIGNQKKHVMSYLGDFLFSPERAQSPVSSLSGGERARLLLARLFARPTNVLVMDEPTNDLDIETLELLEELIQGYKGTVLLVSHDREFLNNVVTQTIAWEGEAYWRDYPGGYDDWLFQKPKLEDSGKKSIATNEGVSASKKTSESNRAVKQSRMTSWEIKELTDLPEKIASLEKEQALLTNQLSDPANYQESGKVDSINEQLSLLEAQLLKHFERWELLEAKKEGN